MSDPTGLSNLETMTGGLATSRDQGRWVVVGSGYGRSGEREAQQCGGEWQPRVFHEFLNSGWYVR